jgi:regulatory protein
LERKGISEELIQAVHGSLFMVHSDLEMAMKLAKKRIERYAKIEDKRKVYEKLGRFLASKGFNWDTIKEVIDQVLAK